MLPDRVSNPGPLTYESGALTIALRSPAFKLALFVRSKTVKMKADIGCIRLTNRSVFSVTMHNRHMKETPGGRYIISSFQIITLLPYKYRYRTGFLYHPFPPNNFTTRLTTKKQTTKFSSANKKNKNVKSKLYHIKNSKTRGQTK